MKYSRNPALRVEFGNCPPFGGKVVNHSKRKRNRGNFLVFQQAQMLLFTLAKDYCKIDSYSKRVWKTSCDINLANS